MTTTNPYAPPETDAAGTAPAGPPPQKSFARRLSFILAGVGFAGFWGPIAGMASGVDNALAEVVLGLAMLAAMVAHFLGMVIMFAAPRGRRLVPVLLNAVAFTIIIGVMILGVTIGKE
jgi:hypothetical protein